MLVVFALLSFAAPVLQEGSTAPAPVKKDRVICQKAEVTGSRLGAKRICKKESEWAQQYREDNAKIRIDQDQPFQRR